ncbi:MAG TPA: right-handed parallel beta-helix repeat-containing protein [Mycobacteriales bacterium]|nr:right-handed parallel beta-helix repeat-containing protein [Mycobacteriales bacterium]
MLNLHTRRAAAVVALTLGAAAGGVFIAQAPAMAAGQTRYVATTGDDADNDCTDAADPCLHIQYAVDQADPGDTVSIAAGKYDESVEIRQSLTLIGAGATGSGRTTIDGDGEDGPSIWVDGFDTDTPPQVTVKDIDVTGNSDDDGILVTGDPGAGDPVGITIVDCVVDGNDDNGIELDGSVTGSVNDTTISGNDDEGLTTDEINDDPPVITMSGDVVSSNGDGGVVNESGSIAIDSTTIDDNTGAGVVVDGGGNTVNLRTTTVSGTVSFTESEGPAFGGGVLVFPGGVSDIQSSTIFGNTGQGVLSIGGDVSVKNTTISGTIASTSPDPEISDGGVVTNAELPAVAKTGMAQFAHHDRQANKRHLAAPKASAIETSSATLTATITADNTTLPDCAGDVVDGGYNLDSDDSCGFNAKGSVNNGTAKLGPLANNGGPTKTLLPAKGSDAIDAIPAANASCTTPANDQRGESRPQGPACDIGAVEAAQPPIVITPKSLPSGKVGNHYSVSLTATGGLGAPYEWSLSSSSGPLPPGLHLSSHGVISGTPTTAGSYPIIASVDDPTLKHYTIVITAARRPSSGPSGSSSPPQGTTLPNTGADVGLLVTFGGLAVAIGIVLMGATGLLGRRRAYRRLH